MYRYRITHGGVINSVWRLQRAASTPSINRFSPHDLPSLRNHMRVKDIAPCT